MKLETMVNAIIRRTETRGMLSASGITKRVTAEAWQTRRSLTCSRSTLFGAGVLGSTGPLPSSCPSAGDGRRADGDQYYGAEAQLQRHARNGEQRSIERYTL